MELRVFKVELRVLRENFFTSVPGDGRIDVGGECVLGVALG